MKTIILSLLLALGLAVGLAAPAQAGSDNGTNNWYSSARCDASGGNLVVTNYDIKGSDGTVWQEYHIDADRAGGTGAVPVVNWRVSGNSTWNSFAGYWNDFFWRMSNQWLFHDFRVTFANGSRCYIWAL